jgi:RNA-directed DNA polymerase
VPTVADRVAQTAAKLLLEPQLEPLFHDDSYGYRPGRSALDAVGVVRRRCWKYDWVVEFDIKGLFDNIDHALLLRALRKHCQEAWVLLYIERWLVAPLQTENGELQPRTKGTPQGGVISPILANLFLHYAFDAWLSKELRSVRFCRYADDAVVLCKSLAQAQYVLDRIGARLRQCGLELHPDKTHIVYCQDINRRADHPVVQFTFLGYTFRPRKAVDKYGRVYVNFAPAVSRDALRSAYFSPSWTAFQADRGRDFSVIVDGVSV